MPLTTDPTQLPQRAPGTSAGTPLSPVRPDTPPPRPSAADPFNATPQSAPPAGTQATAPKVQQAPAQASAPATPPASPPAPSTATNGGSQLPPPTSGTVRNPGAPNPVGNGLQQQYYGSTQSSPGRAQGSLQPAYGSTQRNTGLSPEDNARPTVGLTPYGATQSLVAPSQSDGSLPIYGGTQGNPANGLAAPSNRSLTGTALPGNTAGNTRAPVGSVPLTRDQIGSFGGAAGYDARGVYTGTSGSTVGYGQPYAPLGRPVGGLLSNNTDATGPLRPYIPQNTSLAGPPNSGYGIPNGSRPSTMDARGIQRVR